MIRLRILFVTLLMLVFNTNAFAQLEGEEDLAAGHEVTPTFTPGTRARTPIDMYEGALMLVATSMIVGYYFVKNRRQVN